MRVALGIEYDGSRFLGWQTQSGGGTVQDALETALAAIAGERVAVTCAGRTDRGVHALGQVVHFETAASRPESAWVRGVNAMLPDNSKVLSAWRTELHRSNSIRMNSPNHGPRRIRQYLMLRSTPCSSFSLRASFSRFAS